MLEEQENLDTQETPVEETAEPVEEQVEAPENEETEPEESGDSFDIGEAFGDEEEEVTDNSDAPLSDLKALIKADPDKALERVAQVEAGLVKLQAQKAEAEEVVTAITTTLQGLESGDLASINKFEEMLYENTGLTFSALVEIQGGTKPAVQKADPKVEILEKRLEAIEREKAATAWIESTGRPAAKSVLAQTGLEFSPELLWEARTHLKRGATADDVRKAVMKVNPDAYDKAVAKRDGETEQPPRAATMPSGRSSTKTTFTHDAVGFLQAYQAKKARAG